MKLNIGTTAEGASFTLPEDLGDKKIAVLAQSKKGKTYGLGCILEELENAGRPFIATDPANNFWGLRVLPDGRPSGRQVVVIGGDHADIPFEKDAGERMAEALLSTPICAVIDVAFESLGNVRRFMTDFASRLMQTKPEIPRVIVLEEAPVLIPQKARGPQMEICKAAVSKLATIGGNFGYGVIPASQRAATIDKDVLSQCEGLIVMGMTHSKDRETVREWMEAKDIENQAADAFKELGSLKPGEAWYWNPADDVFQKFTFRKRLTLHPREMQKLGLKASAVKLGDMQAFVEKVKKELSRKVVAVHVSPKAKPETVKALANAAECLGGATAGNPNPTSGNRLVCGKCEALEKENHDLRQLLDDARGLSQSSLGRLRVIREHLRPQWEALSKLFTELGAPEIKQSQESPEIWSPWLARAGKAGCRRVLELLIKHGRLKQRQLATLAGIQYGNRSWRDYKRFLLQNSLAKEEGEDIEIVRLTA